MTSRPPRVVRRFVRWLLDAPDATGPAGPGTSADVPGDPGGRGTPGTRPWWAVMGLMGVDYASTLAYQPGIAFLAAGALSPVATLVLVLVTLLAALPVYRHVAGQSAHGQGSLRLLERLLPWWPGKLTVLVLLGFLVTDFVLTVTLSAASAAQHLVESDLVRQALSGRDLPVALALVVLLGVAFLRGARERVTVAVLAVGTYVVFNAVLIGWGVARILGEPALLQDWQRALVTQHGSPLMALALAALLFPKLALGLSGFETGVSVMPLVKGDPDDTPSRPRGRIRATRRLLTVAALVMSVLLLGSSFVTTLLIPPEEFRTGGAAGGRALAYLAHRAFGPVGGGLYDLVTVTLLWLAALSGMSRLLAVVPRVLPRYGMAPGWIQARRPLVLLFTAVCATVTVVYRADVNGQAAAYTTGVLVIITAAAISAYLAARRAYESFLSAAFGLISLVFVYTTVANVIERPEGIRIAAVFIVGVVAVSLVSRATRSTELRAAGIDVDRAAERFLIEAGGRPLRFIAHHPPARPDDVQVYDRKAAEIRAKVHLSPDESAVFVEVHVADASEFVDVVEVRGVQVGGHRVLRVESASVPNAIAAVLLYARDVTGRVPHVYFAWNERGPVSNAARFLAAGEGDVAMVTHEILRQVERDRARRPVVHLGG